LHCITANRALKIIQFKKNAISGHRVNAQQHGNPWQNIPGTHRVLVAGKNYVMRNALKWQKTLNYYERSNTTAKYKFLDYYCHCIGMYVRASGLPGHLEDVGHGYFKAGRSGKYSTDHCRYKIAGTGASGPPLLFPGP
jgi:hypothetical protein